MYLFIQFIFIQNICLLTSALTQTWRHVTFLFRHVSSVFILIFFFFFFFLENLIMMMTTTTSRRVGTWRRECKISKRKERKRTWKDTTSNWRFFYHGDATGVMFDLQTQVIVYVCALERKSAGNKRTEREKTRECIRQTNRQTLLNQGRWSWCDMERRGLGWGCRIWRSTA